MEPMNVINQVTGRNQLNGTGRLGVVPIAAAAGVIALVKKIKPLADTAAKIANVLGLGGSDQTRFINRYYELKDYLKANGYDGVGDNLSKWLDKYDVRKTDVDNNKKQDYWYAAFQRLRLLFIDWLNFINPGLGTDYGRLFPEWKMKSEGQIHSAPIEAIKLIVKEFPKGSYLPGTLQQVLANLPTQPQGPATAAPQNLVTKVIDGYTLVKDAQGQIKEIRDAAGRLVSPTDPRYSDITDKDIQTKQAGTGGLIVGGIIGTALLYTMFNGNSTDNKKPVNGPPAKKKSKKRGRAKRK